MLKTSKVVALNSDTQAAQALILNDSSTSGYSLYIILHCQSDDAFTRCRQALAVAETTFFSSESVLSQRLDEVISSISESLADTQNLWILLAGTSKHPNSGQVLYLMTNTNHLSASLMRHNQLSSLVPEGAQMQLISGFMDIGDRVVLSTKSFFNLFADEAKKLLSLPIDEVEDAITSSLPQSEIMPLSLIVIEDKDLTVKDEEASFEPKFSPKINFSFKRPQISFPNFSVNKKLLIIPVLLLALLLGFFGFKKFLNHQNNQSQSSAQSLVDQANVDYQKAKSLKDTDFNQAVVSFNEAQNLLSQAQKQDPKNSQVSDLQKLMDQDKGDILKVYTFTDLPIWLDLSLIKPGFSTDSLSFSVGKILLLDTNSQTLVLLDQNKAHQILAGKDQLGEGTLASLNGDFAYVFSVDKGVVKVDMSGDSPKASVVFKTDDSWSVIKDLVAFAGNVYLLDPGKNQIWKYVGGESGFSDKKTYFSDNISINDAKKMEIDSSVWLLKSNTQLIKYTQGQEDTFSISGLDKNISSIKAFYVSDKTDNLYIVDPDNKRVVVLSKKGEYLKQYIWDKITTIEDIAVDEDGKKIYLLDGKKIYLMDLK